MPFTGVRQHSRQLPTAVVQSLPVVLDARSKFVRCLFPVVLDARTRLSQAPISVSVRMNVGEKLYCDTYRTCDILVSTQDTDGYEREHVVLYHKNI